MNLDLDRSAWERVRFGDVVRNVNETVKDAASASINRVIALEHLNPGELQISRWGDVADGTTFTKRVRPGQTLFGKRRAYQRKAAYAEFEAITSGDILVFEANPTRMLPNLLPFLVQSEPFFAHALDTSAGSLSPRTNWADLATFEFDLPPLDEQQRIADLLWAERHSRADLQELRDQLRVARAVFIERVLADSDDRREFSSIWSRSPESGWSAQPVDAATGSYVLALSALTDEGYARGGLKSVEPTAEVVRTRVAKGDLLISRANTIDAVGRVGIFDEEREDVSFPDTMMRLHINQALASTNYVLEVLKSRIGRTHIRRTAAGTNSSMLKINRQSLGRLQVPLLERRAQDELVERAASFDEWLAVHKKAFAGTVELSAAILKEVWH